MKIAYVATGAAGMYCGTCLQDNALAAALLQEGQDVALVPTYTPLRTDEPDVSGERVFFGALNVFLQQVAAPFRHTPAPLDRLLDRPGLLRWISRFGASTDPSGLGALTLSMLRGEQGFQAKELRKLAAWLRDDFRPDLVHLSNSLIAGFARTLKRELAVPVVCTVQGEDLFLDGLEARKREVLETLRERARDVDAFVTHSRWYAGFMAEYLRVEPGRFHVVPLGLSLAGHGEAPPRPTPEEPKPFTVGYLARVCPEKGFGVLVEAFRQLAAEMGPEAVRLEVAGYLAERNRGFLREQEERLAAWGLAGSYRYRGEVDREGKIGFLHEIDVLSVPTVYREPKGLFVLEALANGVPVVQPRHGAFPELVEATGGGLLVEPSSPPALAAGLAELLGDPGRRRELGRRGREAVHARFSDRDAARRMLAVYERTLVAARPAA